MAAPAPSPTTLDNFLHVSRISTLNGSLESPLQDRSNNTLFGLIALVLQKRFDFEIWGLFGCLHQDLSWVMSKEALKGGRLEPDHNGQALTAQCLGSTSSNVHANKSTGGGACTEINSG